MKYTLTGNGSITCDKALTKEQALTISGTWGSGTMTIAVIDGFSTDAVTRDSWTSDDKKAIAVGRGKQMKLTLAGATNPSLTIYVEDLYE